MVSQGPYLVKSLLWIFQGKTEEAKKLAEFEAEQKEKEKLMLNEQKAAIDKNFQQVQVQNYNLEVPNFQVFVLVKVFQI